MFLLVVVFSLTPIFVPCWLREAWGSITVKYQNIAETQRDGGHFGWLSGSLTCTEGSACCYFLSVWRNFPRIPLFRSSL